MEATGDLLRANARARVTRCELEAAKRDVVAAQVAVVRPFRVRNHSATIAFAALANASSRDPRAQSHLAASGDAHCANAQARALRCESEEAALASFLVCVAACRCHRRHTHTQPEQRRQSKVPLFPLRARTHAKISYMPPKKEPPKPKVQKMVGKPVDEGSSDDDAVAKSKDNAKNAPKTAKAAVVRNCSIVTVPGGEIPTIVGPISQWAPVVENLPNNPTCVSIALSLLCPRLFLLRNNANTAIARKDKDKDRTEKTSHRNSDTPSL